MTAVPTHEGFSPQVHQGRKMAAGSPAGWTGQMRTGEVRRGADSGVTIRAFTQGADNGRLSNLTLHGCNLHLDTLQLRPGQIVSIVLACNSSVPGIVRWARGENVGLEFFRPLNRIMIAGCADLSGQA